jgi:hypothetical protein
MRYVLTVAATLVVAAIAVGCDAASPPPTPLYVPASGVCTGVPVYPADQAPASLPLTPDATLEAKFPIAIDGQAVNGLASAHYVESLCALGGESSIDAAIANLSPDINLADLRVASAQVQMDTQVITINAFRLPGHSAHALLPVVGILADTVAPSAAKFASLVPTQFGGKAVYIWTDTTTGAISYLYPAPDDDTLFIVEGGLPSQAEKVLTALR